MTYSIIAHDRASGQLGVAVQSHWFSVGSQVPWARPGVGAVATQAATRVDYGPRGLELMRNGATAATALTTLSARDDERATRQVAMVDAVGRVAASTGGQCIAFAGDVQGDGVSCQGNLLADAAVWPAMLEAYRTAPAPTPLCDRLLAALLAGQEAGGDLRGVQSAALLVVPATGEPWETVVSLRVEDSEDPLGELARLLPMSRAYAATGEGNGSPTVESAMRAAGLAPDSVELAFWAAVRAGDDVSGFGPRWRELRRRLG
jgi:uncharacterized Ntn-hydrolase superfamily protein